MIWLSWRQFRGQAMFAAAALAAASTYLVILGVGIRDHYDGDIANCGLTAACNAARIAFNDRYETPLTIICVLVLAMPALVGVFWGAPLTARELEAGTHRLVWTQGTSRRAWLAAKLGIAGLAAAAMGTLLGLLVSWSSHPLNGVKTHFSVLGFDSHDVVPAAYAVFACALGATCGLLVRRTVAAMAVTLLVFVTIQFAVPVTLRRHLAAPLTATRAFTANVVRGHPLTFETTGTHSARYVGDLPAGAWTISVSSLLDASGRPADVSRCLNTNVEATTLRCMVAARLHWTTTYQPASRYWRFQWTEAALFLMLAAGLTGVCAWRIRRTS